MTDQELLELAAKAAGITGTFHHGTLNGDVVAGIFTKTDGIGEIWNPLTDDGDALRLAVKLRMCVDPWGAGASAVVTINNRALVAEPHYGDDVERATRRAIVRAAAEIGKAL